MNDISFRPDWISAPGSTIAEILRERGLSLTDFAARLGYSKEKSEKLLRGQTAITQEIAAALARAIGGSESFWINREAQYREDVARLGTKGNLEAQRAWLNELPVVDMAKFDWIQTTSSLEDRIQECLRFFEASDIADWRRKYGNLLQAVSFRTSATYDSEPGAVLAWLRFGEASAKKSDCRPWNPTAFKNALVQARKLTRIREPKIFVARLKALCAQCGVALVIAKAPRGCRASGATRFIAPDKAMILLSFRHLVDDQFWFTFFHEAGHLILHSKRALFLEDHSEVTSTEEQEANEFAEDILIPRELREEMVARTHNRTTIMRLAVKLGIARGIVVGQLQHKGFIRPDQFNWLKRRFNWEEIDTAF